MLVVGLCELSNEARWDGRCMWHD